MACPSLSPGSFRCLLSRSSEQRDRFPRDLISTAAPLTPHCQFPNSSSGRSTSARRSQRDELRAHGPSATSSRREALGGCDDEFGPQSTHSLHRPGDADRRPRRARSASLTRRIRQPMVIAEIVAGIVLGPVAARLAARPEVEGALFPATSLPAARHAEPGRPHPLHVPGRPRARPGAAARARPRRRSPSATPASSCRSRSGRRLALYLYPRLRDPTASRSSSFALFMGVAMSITAFPGAGAHPRRAPPAADEGRRGRDHLRRRRRRHGVVHPRLRGRRSCAPRSLGDGGVDDGASRSPTSPSMLCVVRPLRRPAGGAQRQPRGAQPEPRRRSRCCCCCCRAGSPS